MEQGHESNHQNVFNETAPAQTFIKEWALRADMAFPMEIDRDKSEFTETSATIAFKGTDTTLIIPIIDELNKNKDVKIVRFINKHPELEDTKLFVEMRQGSPVDAIRTACDAVSAFFSECKVE